MTFKLYLLTLVIFLGADAVWLGLVAPKFYRAQTGHLMAEKSNLSRRAGLQKPLPDVIPMSFESMTCL
jgi:hypothetical protein